MLCGRKDRVQHKGIYFVRGATVHLFSQKVDHPNGLAFSPNERYLYVTNTMLENVLRFDVKPDGTGSNERTFVDMSGDPAEGAPDGIKIDGAGNVYCTGPGGIWILSPTGKHLGTILTPERLTNFTFGGNDGQWIYMVSANTLYRIPLKVRASTH
jgi:gluconolactonase